MGSGILCSPPRRRLTSLLTLAGNTQAAGASLPDSTGRGLSPRGKHYHYATKKLPEGSISTRSDAQGCFPFGKPTIRHLTHLLPGRTHAHYTTKPGYACKYFESRRALRGLRLPTHPIIAPGAVSARARPLLCWDAVWPSIPIMLQLRAQIKPQSFFGNSLDTACIVSYHACITQRSPPNDR